MLKPELSNQFKRDYGSANMNKRGDENDLLYVRLAFWA